MIAQYLDDIPAIIGRMMGRNKGVPSGYGFFYGKNAQPRFGPIGKMAAREAQVGKKGFGVLSRPMRGIGSGVEHFHGNFGKLGVLGILGAGTFEAYSAKRGHKATHFAKGVMSGIAFGVGDVVGTVLSGGNMLAGFAVGTAFEKVGAAAGDLLDQFSNLNNGIRHINMGGNYEDSRIAYTMRQRAAQEMGSSVMNARAWLGKEAALMHQ